MIEVPIAQVIASLVLHVLETVIIFMLVLIGVLRDDYRR